MHPLRRGAARASMSTGGTFAQPLRSGQWRRDAVRLYIDLDDGGRRVMVDILIEGSED